MTFPERSTAGSFPVILVRGGGDLASGVVLRLARCGLKVIVSELAQPLAVRRSVSFAEAVYSGRVVVEGLTGRSVTREGVLAALDAGEIPVVVDPLAGLLKEALRSADGRQARISVVVDGRLAKRPPEPLPAAVDLHVGLGPGFAAGENCHAAIETRRSHTLGRVYWSGSPQADSGLPEGDPRRVLRAPVAGVLHACAEIGDHVEQGQVVAEITPPERAQPVGDRARAQIPAPFPGVLRGLLHPGLQVVPGLKIGDVDPRDDPSACRLVSDKALSIGGGVLEAMLSRPDVRAALWDE